MIILTILMGVYAVMGAITYGWIGGWALYRLFIFMSHPRLVIPVAVLFVYLGLSHVLPRVRVRRSRPRLQAIAWGISLGTLVTYLLRNQEVASWLVAAASIAAAAVAALLVECSQRFQGKTRTA